MIGYCLILGESDTWWGLPAVLRQHLTTHERVSLAFMALKGLDPDQIQMTAKVALGGAGSPGASLFGHMDEAVFWSDMAAPEELDAYCLASFNRMAPDRQAAFLGFVQGRQAA